MKLPLYIAATTLVILATSCSKDKITPNGQSDSNGELEYNTTVVVFDAGGDHNILYKIESDDAEVLSRVATELESSTLDLDFAGEGSLTDTGVTLPGEATGSTYAGGGVLNDTGVILPGSSANGDINGVVITAVEINIGTATGYTVQR